MVRIIFNSKIIIISATSIFLFIGYFLGIKGIFKDEINEIRYFYGCKYDQILNKKEGVCYFGNILENGCHKNYYENSCYGYSFNYEIPNEINILKNLSTNRSFFYNDINFKRKDLIEAIGLNNVEINKTECKKLIQISECLTSINSIGQFRYFEKSNESNKKNVILLHGMGSSAKKILGISKYPDYHLNIGKVFEKNNYNLFALDLIYDGINGSKLNEQILQKNMHIYGIFSKIVCSIINKNDGNFIIYGLSHGGEVAKFISNSCRSNKISKVILDESITNKRHEIWERKFRNDAHETYKYNFLKPIYNRVSDLWFLENAFYNLYITGQKKHLEKLFENKCIKNNNKKDIFLINKNLEFHAAEIDTVNSILNKENFNNNNC